jgi:Protein of unknown function (DUF3618)
MDDKNPRVDEERITGRGEDQVAGRGTDDTGTSGARVPPSDAAPARDPYSTPTAPTYTDVTPSVSRPSEPVVPPPRSTSPSYRPNESRGAEAAEEVAPGTRQIRAEIEQTRGQMSETVNAIQDRLRPSTIASNAAESVKQVASDSVRGVTESEPAQYIRANPIASTMVAIGVGGLAWVAFGSRRPTPRYLRDRHDRRHAGATQAGAGSSGRQSHLRYDAGSQTRNLQERTWEAARTTEARVQRSWNSNPLLLGAMSLILGAIVGAAVPESDRENEWLGETRDNLVEGVQQSVKQTVQKVQNVASVAVGLTSEEEQARPATPNGVQGSND